MSVMSGLSLETRLPNLKSVPLAILDLIHLSAFNAPKFTGSRDRDHAHFSEIFVRGRVWTIPGNTPAKFEVRIFSRFGADRQTDRQTDRNRPIRNDSVVNGDHAHLLDTLHTTRNRFKRFYSLSNAANAVHWTDNKLNKCILVF